MQKYFSYFWFVRQAVFDTIEDYKPHCYELIDTRFEDEGWTIIVSIVLIQLDMRMGVWTTGYLSTQF